MSKGPGIADESDLAELIGILARVRSLEQRYFESLALADRALEIAEPMELFEVIADALGTKGNILTQHGRSIEGVSLLETARRVAQEHGLTAMEARAITGLSISLATRDVRATWALELEGIEFARRTGRRDFEMTILGNGGEDAIRLGEWDWHATQVAHFDDIELAPLQRVALGFPAAVIATLRGREGNGRRSTRFREAIVAVQGTDYAISRRRPRRLGGDDRRTVRRGARRVVQAGRGRATPTPRSRFRARRGRRSSLATPPGRARRSPGSMRSASAARCSRSSARRIGAGIDGLDGRTKDAIAGFRAAMAAWRDGGVLWDEAWTAWCALAVLGTDHPEVVTMGREGRAILVKLRANAVIAHFDRLLGDATARRPGRSRRVAAPVAESVAAEVVEPA